MLAIPKFENFEALLSKIEKCNYDYVVGKHIFEFGMKFKWFKITAKMCNVCKGIWYLLKQFRKSSFGEFNCPMHIFLVVLQIFEKLKSILLF